MAITDTYKLLSDEELVAKYHSGDEKAADYLIEKYKNLGCDEDEALIKTFKEVRGK